MKQLHLWIDNQPVSTKETMPVYNKATGECIAEMAIAGADEICAAADAAEKAFRTIQLSPYERYAVIHKAAELLLERQESFAAMLPETSTSITGMFGSPDKGQKRHVLPKRV